MTGAGPGWPGHVGGPPGADEIETGSFVRPFVLTGGRTRPVDERLRVETLISAAPAALAAPPSFERGRIVRLCRRPLSVAEISRELGVPVGVARVLIADLAAERLVTVHDTVHDALDDVWKDAVRGPAGSAARPSVSLALLERIRDGVRAL